MNTEIVKIQCMEGLLEEYGWYDEEGMRCHTADSLEAAVLANWIAGGDMSVRTDKQMEDAIHTAHLIIQIVGENPSQKLKWEPYPSIDRFVKENICMKCPCLDLINRENEVCVQIKPGPFATVKCVVLHSFRTVGKTWDEVFKSGSASFVYCQEEEPEGDEDIRDLVNALEDRIFWNKKIEESKKA